MYAAVFASRFALQAATRLEPELRQRSLAIIDDSSSVLEMTDIAAATGIFAGMSPSQALARDSTLLLKNVSSAMESNAQEILIETTCHHFPYVENTAPGLVTVDLRSLNRHSHQDWIPLLIEQSKRAGLDLQIGIAPNPILAFQAARSCQAWQRIEQPLDLPVEILALTPELADLLRDWGIRTLEQLRKLPRSALGERLGVPGLELWDQAAGRAQRVLRLVRPKEQFREIVELEYGIETLEPLLFLIRKGLNHLLVRLEAAWFLTSELDLTLRMDNGEFRTRKFRLPCPTRDAELLFRVLFTHLETQQTEAPLIGFSLEATPCAAPKHQFGLFETTLRDPNRFFETFARLRALVGNDRVGAPLLRDTYRPDAVDVEPPRLEEVSLRVAEAEEESPPSVGPVLRRYRPPSPAVVICREDGTPSLLESKNMSASVSRALGPWHASGEWWDTQGWEFEEWDIQTHDGRLFRLARGQEGWRLIGEYD